MGAEQSYQKADTPKISFENDIYDLQEYLKPIKKEIKIMKEYDISDIDIDKYSLFDLLKQSVSIKDKNKIMNDSKLLDKIKISLDMYLLYDNYNLNHKVLLKDLSKKLENQNKKLKGKSEEIDILNYKLNDIKLKTKKNYNIKLLLIIGIILLVILITVISILIYLKVN